MYLLIVEKKVKKKKEENKLAFTFSGATSEEDLIVAEYGISKFTEYAEGNTKYDFLYSYMKYSNVPSYKTAQKFGMKK